jgi:hypothetical protein
VRLGQVLDYIIDTFVTRLLQGCPGVLRNTKLHTSNEDFPEGDISGPIECCADRITYV